MTQLLDLRADGASRTRPARPAPAPERDRFYREVLESMPIAVWTRNTRGDTVYLSAAVEKLSGFTVRELTEGLASDATFWLQRVHPEDVVNVAMNLERFLRADVDSIECEYRWRTKGGAWVWLHTRSVWRTQPDGELVWDCLIDDVTARHRLEESLRQAQRLEAVGQLAGGVAHDFNNILTIILANAHFLMSDLAAEDPRREQADEIQQAAQRATALTRQLLLFSRKQVLKPEDVSLAGTVQQLCKMLGRLIGEDVKLTFSAEEDAGIVHADRAQLEQVVLNLAVNARDAMPNGGRLDIEVKNVSVPTGLQVNSGELAAGDYVKLTVRDTGCGIAPELQARVFEPFFTTKAEGHGTGLGLSTVIAIVTEAKGGLGLESVAGQGAAFSVYLPRVTVERDAQGEPRQRPQAKLDGNETILLVEDEDMVSSVATRILKSAGYEVLVARSVDTATRVVERDGVRLALVLADVVMPGTSGPELVAQLRRMRPGLKALYMSGYSHHAALEAHQLEGHDPLVRKPFTSLELLREVRAVLDEKETAPSP